MKFKPESITAEELDAKIAWGCDPTWAHSSVGPGWFRLIWDLVDDLNDLACDYKAVQVKEKFGGLRFYYEVSHADGCAGKENYGDCPIAKRVSEAETISDGTCETCGKPGEIREGGWVQSLCDDCAKAKQRR